MKTITRPRSFVFAITVAWIRYYWTGNYDREGKLERSAHRADAFKFPSSETALLCAQTHVELRDSDAWKLVPLSEKVHA